MKLVFSVVMNYYYANYLTNNRSERRDWLVNFLANLPQYAAQYGVTATQITRMENGLIWINRGITLLTLRESFGKSLTAFADELDTDATENDAHEPQWEPGDKPTVSGRTGTFNFVIQTVNATFFANGTMPPQVVMDALGLNPIAPASPTDPAIISLTTAPGGVVELKFSRGGFPQVIIEGRRNGGAWELLKEVAGTHWPDARPNLVAGQSEVREYRIRYSNGMAGVGNYSEVRSVATQA